MTYLSVILVVIFSAIINNAVTLQNLVLFKYMMQVILSEDWLGIIIPGETLGQGKIFQFACRHMIRIPPNSQKDTISETLVAIPSDISILNLKFSRLRVILFISLSGKAMSRKVRFQPQPAYSAQN